MTVQGTDCRAKEAESLEQARRTDDEDLKNLYATIANQWHLLAEGIEKRRSIQDQAIPIHKDRDVLTAQPRARVDPADTLPLAHFDHDIVWPGHRDELITFDARPVEERNDQIARHEHIVPELQIEAGHPGNSTYPISEIGTAADQVGVVARRIELDQVADAPGQCSPADQSGNLTGPHAASSDGLEAPTANVDQLTQDRVEPVLRGVETRTNSISETNTSMAPAKAHSEPAESLNEQLETPAVSHFDSIEGPDDQISRASSGGDPVMSDTGRTDNHDDQIARTDPSNGQMSHGLEDMVSPAMEISDGDHSALSSNGQHQRDPPDLSVNNSQSGLKIDAEKRVCEDLGGSAVGSELAQEQVGRSRMRVETPLEWFFSFWLNPRRR